MGLESGRPRTGGFTCSWAWTCQSLDNLHILFPLTFDFVLGHALRWHLSTVPETMPMHLGEGQVRVGNELKPEYVWIQNIKIHRNNCITDPRAWLWHLLLAPMRDVYPHSDVESSWCLAYGWEKAGAYALIHTRTGSYDRLYMIRYQRNDHRDNISQEISRIERRLG